MESAEVRQAEIKIPRVLIKWAFLLGLVRLSEPFGRTRRRTPQRWELRVENQERLAKIKRPPHTEKGERDLVRCFAYPPPRCALQDPAKPRWRQREHPPPDDPFLDTPPQDKHLGASQHTTAETAVQITPVRRPHTATKNLEVEKSDYTVAPTTPVRRSHTATKNLDEEKSENTVTKLVIREKERVDVALPGYQARRGRREACKSKRPKDSRRCRARA